MRNRFTTRWLLLVCTLVLLGCGQTGPLYLPDNPEPSPEPSPETDTSESPER